MLFGLVVLVELVVVKYSHSTVLSIHVLKLDNDIGGEGADGEHKSSLTFSCTPPTPS